MDGYVFLDLQDTPHLLPPIPAGALNTDLLVRVVLGTLEAAGATAADILSSFYPDPVLWPLPPRLMFIGQQGFGMRAGVRSSFSVQTLQEVHKRYRQNVTRTGFTVVTRAMLAEGFGPRVMHPLMFSDTEPSAESADIFSMEYILAIEAGGSKVSVSGPRVARKYAGKRTSRSQVVLDKAVSPTLTPEFVQHALFAPRGTAVYPTVDIFDRCLLWAKNHMVKEDTALLNTALSWLKAVQSKELAYDFEQALHTLEPFAPWIDAGPSAKNIYTYESLNYARDLWVLSDKDDHEAFRDFYSYIVPTFLDDGHFRQLFRTGMVLAVDFNDDIRKRLDAGMPKFEGWFIKMMRQT
jgi:hypothetical protein